MAALHLRRAGDARADIVAEVFEHFVGVVVEHALSGDGGEGGHGSVAKRRRDGDVLRRGRIFGAREKCGSCGEKNNRGSDDEKRKGLAFHFSNDLSLSARAMRDNSQKRNALARRRKKFRNEAGVHSVK